ncbi:chitin synthase-domain-containing protein [Melanogaster broomeanus]|nr:chitin synthase-domain-containing protein [Melanogaster broomeanus]
MRSRKEISIVYGTTFPTGEVVFEKIKAGKRPSHDECELILATRDEIPRKVLEEWKHKTPSRTSIHASSGKGKRRRVSDSEESDDEMSSHYLQDTPSTPRTTHSAPNSKLPLRRSKRRCTGPPYIQRLELKRLEHECQCAIQRKGFEDQMRALEKKAESAGPLLILPGTVSPWVQLNSANNTDVNAQYHDFRAITNDSRPDWYFESMTLMRWNNRVGYVGYNPQEITNMANTGYSLGIYNSMIYDLTTYVNSGHTIVNLFQQSSGQDVMKLLDALPLDTATLDRQKTCFRNLFLIGMVHNRNSPQCLFSEYILLALSAMMVSIIAFKFIASINFASPRAPSDHDKFVIYQVPCYTEGETSLRRTIDSLAQLKYDDKRKLISVICDGNIVGSGNDRPTPRLVLDILGADPNLDPEPLSFLSLGRRSSTAQYGKIYSACMSARDMWCVGKPTERSRPGNRGKRDSQMVMMHFLNKVHFNSPMNPLELEIYHQIKNVIGVNPTFYEYLFTIDADTTVEPYSLNRLISA